MSLYEPIGHVSLVQSGKNEFLEFRGYRRHLGKRLFIAVLSIASFGLFYVVLRWKPRWRISATCNRCSLENANVVLVTDSVIPQSPTIVTVKEIVSTLTPEKLFEPSLTDAETASMEQSHNRRNTHQSITSFSSKKMVRLRYVEYAYSRFVWFPACGAFRPLGGLDEVYDTCEELLKSCSNGWKESEQRERQEVYGPGAMIIRVKSLLTHLIDEILNPFYFFQLASIGVWIADEYYYYAWCIIAVTTATICIALWETRRQYVQMEKMVKISNEASAYVLRRGGLGVPVELPSRDLVPGDVIVIPRGGCIMTCDALLLDGTCLVNESMLTGESVPETKTGIDYRTHFNSPVDLEDQLRRHALFSGTEILRGKFYSKEHIRALVIRTGFSTSKGELIRRMLLPRRAANDSQFLRDSLMFLSAMFVLAALGMICTLYLYIQRGETIRETVLRALDIVTIVVPPALPAALTISTVYAQNRLRRQGVFCTRPSRIHRAGRLNLCCFDKTGTLTEEGLTFWGVLPCASKAFLPPVTKSFKLEQSAPLMCALASCHTLSTLNGKLVGDPIDLEMFEFTGWTLEEPEEDSFESLAPTVVKPPAILPAVTRKPSKSNLVPGTEMRRTSRHLLKNSKTRSPPPGIVVTPDVHRSDSIVSARSLTPVSPLALIIDEDEELASSKSFSFEAGAVGGAAKTSDGNTTVGKSSSFGFLLDAGNDNGAQGCAAALSAINEASDAFVDSIDVAAGLPIEFIAQPSKSIDTVDGDALVVRPPTPVEVTVAAVEGEDVASAAVPNAGSDVIVDALDASWAMPMGLEVGIVRHFPFSSATQRTTVVCRILGSRFMDLFVKGAPERVTTLCSPDSLPKDFESVLRNYTLQGFRVLALAHRQLEKRWTWHHVYRSQRDEMETSAPLKFLGLLVMRNNLKSESKPVIQLLRGANIRTVMVTGDNLLTAVSVARECEMIRGSECALVVSATLEHGVRFERTNGNPPLECDAAMERSRRRTGNRGRVDSMTLLAQESLCFCMDGNTFFAVKTHFPEMLHLVLSKSAVFARMTPEHKTVLVETYQKFGEGRCALTTSISTFKFMALYSLIQFVSVFILYILGTNLSDMMFLYVDLFVTTTLAVTMGYTEPYPSLAKKAPNFTLATSATFISLTGQLTLVVGAQLGTLLYLQAQPWYKRSYEEESWEVTTVFIISCYQYLITSVVLLKGPPFQRPFWTNKLFTASVLLLVLVTTLLVLSPSPLINEFFGLVYFEPSEKLFFRITLLLISIGCGFAAQFVESQLLVECAGNTNSSSTAPKHAPMGGTGLLYNRYAARSSSRVGPLHNSAV